MVEFISALEQATFERTKTQQSWLLFAVALMALMVNVDYTAVNLSLVTIAHHLHSNLNTIQWALSGYMLAWAALIIPAGKQIDSYGQKRMCLIGISLFLFGSVLAGISYNSGLFIIARIIQGISGAIYIPTLYALIFKHFPKQKLGFAMGLLSVGVGFGMAIGPTFGGIVLHYFGWRWIFFINIPIALIALFIINYYSDPDGQNNSEQKLDNIGSIILAGCIVILMFSLSKISSWGIGSPNFIITITTSILLFLCLVLRQHKRKRELTIPFHLFSNRSYTAIVFAFFLEQYAFSASMVLIALFLQKVLGISVLKASAMFLALNLLFGMISPLGGRIVDRVGVKWPAFLGLFMLAIGFIGFSQLTFSSSYGFIYLNLVIIGLGMGIAFSSLNSGMVKTIKESESGIASSIFLLFALLGNTCGVVISMLIYQSIAVAGLMHALLKTMQLSSQQATQLQNIVNYIGEQTYDLSAFTNPAQQKIISLIPSILNAGIANAFLITAMVALVAGILVICFTKKEM